MSNSQAITKIEVPGLKKIASGKVREIFEVDEETLLFVATDRISAYDVILENGVPSKGPILTTISNFWFNLIHSKIPGIKTHLISTQLPSSIPDDVKNQLEGRSMVVRRTPVVPLESIVRGYITGSAWSEYKSKGTVHGMKMPEGMKESEKFPKAVWTPSTKAEQGEHDENISKDRAIQIVGEDVAKRIEEASLEIYELAHAYALSRGIIIADTKFEFGLDPVTNELILIDEVLTPDSSRCWPKEQYEVGKAQSSYDKQYLRDWLTREGLKGKEGVAMPEAVVRETERKYREAMEMLMK
ncbi:Phosphoribosylaminoimidazole-succinocarboxamide synthase [Fulvia fulva]|uniref:Phosphoribosylaminoimidazole-succinocarboxamide synthase n=1 Tax=Passalora fulva TaxID=5499 RepID=A0A9Q8PMB6_PASFU|nr:Phosphoribosylaminoimidazole-succinocarboxamide synthase [Fulvia fulva]KAK4609125.1 Phosphoribosylaminoimidazole-succinocarboxamide synthase [Fulvia fulva]UJO25066.1 Phosphoribosylaminoimidazole-succinocarboxamide synthase [Fulvia fulva]WPV22864.1 Phosphoribosylaminoimidazole-succinocarboxamide synthase [Fulvia fulva]WPV37787.1 Phosphoribosylaminoimidazole-succinocarboxamide synthase [Fulvia fulva]